MPRAPVAAALIALMSISGCAPGPDLGAGPDRRLATLAGTEWQLQTIGAVPAAAGAWITFRSDRTARGDAGCNSFIAGYAFSGGQLSFGPVETTEIACDGPAMAVESAFKAALRAASRAGSSDRRLVLLDGDGSLLVTLVRR
jgi:heat shock protein HslJ